VVRLAAALEGGPAAYAAAPGSDHSLVCLLHRSLAPALARQLADGNARVSAWLSAIDARAVPFAEADGFVNVNATADLQSIAPR
jgi:molybdopterin-guanine dinucleotide biosynthesis protein A